MIDLAIVWHMHQPMYRDPRSGEFILPWVRLHASRAYYDMLRVVERNPEVQVHVNLVPSLLDQLEGYSEGTARDRFLELTERPAADLSLAERAAIWGQFFMVDWQTEVRPQPRYRELLDRRGETPSPEALARRARESTPGELRDLQLLFNLAWTGFALREEDPELRELLRRGRDFREEDKLPVLAAQRRAAQAIVPGYRALQERGQIELTATPHYHPILPLLCDSEVARVALPDRALPTRFQHPEDARRQIAQARASHAVRFGRAPLGMWPAEGSVSEEAAALFAEAGVRWIASDEAVLLRSLEAQGSPADRREIHRSHRLDTASGPIDLVFRDHGLSDLIGFSYAKLSAAAAVADLLGHLQRIADLAGDRERPLVSIVLDGENPWEHYADSGKGFLEGLYRGLVAPESPARTVQLSTHLPQRRPGRLTRLHPGSWIDADFRIWIGHSEDVQGWEALGKVHRALDQAVAAGLDPGRLARAREALSVAEGSDWFWWYGDDFQTDNAAEFDALFRGYLEVACEALGVPGPPEIAAPISAAAQRQRASFDDPSRLRLPTSLIAPRIDGRVTRFGEWAGAGRLPAERARGAMAQGALPFAQLWFGFGYPAGPAGSVQLYLRLDPVAGQSLGALAITLELAGHTLMVRPAREAALQRRGDGGERLGAAAFSEMVELSVPLLRLGLAAGDRVELAVKIALGEVTVQSFPQGGLLGLTAPGPDFDTLHWKV